MPTPFIAITTGYSGSLDAVSFISVRSDSTVVEALSSWFTACLIISFVMASFGSYEQKSVPTSKRGSSDLRKTLFQVMDVLIKTHPQDDPVYQFLDKKRAQGKPYYVYMTAGANKFLRIYYGRVKEYLSSLPEA